MSKKTMISGGGFIMGSRNLDRDIYFILYNLCGTKKRSL